MTANTPISLRLIPAAEKALAELMARTGYNRTDAINRAIQFYNQVNRLPVGTVITLTNQDVNETPYDPPVVHHAVWRGRRRGPSGL